MEHKHIFANRQYYWHNYITHHRCQPVSTNAASLFKHKKYWWYIEIVAFHLVRIPQLKHLDLKRTCN
jgi:hypothetical protein